MGSYNEPYREGRPIKASKGEAAGAAISAVGDVYKKLTNGSSFQLRGGTGKIDSYAAFQRQGLISPMQVEDPPKKKGIDIFSMSNDMRYKLEKKGSFSPGELKAFSGHPKAKDYGAYKAGRDKDVERRRKYS